MANVNMCPTGPDFDKLVNHPDIGRFEAYRDWMENDQQVRSVEEVLTKLNNNKISIKNVKSGQKIQELENKLIDGFLKDFGVTVTEYDDFKTSLGINALSAADIITKSIAYQKGESILPEVAYFAFSMLGKNNNKIRSELRYFINKWDKYKERFNYHTNIIKEKEGFIKNSKVWKNKIRDLVILDFLQENITQYYNNPQEFVKSLDSKWTKEDFTLWNKIIVFIEDLLSKYSSEYKSKKERLSNIGIGIADEILNQNYEYFDYNLKEGQIQKYYNQTIESDPFAKELVAFGQNKLNLILTGSLALRKAGTVYRTNDETLHDIDWVVPYELNDSEVNKKTLNNILAYQSTDRTASAAMAMSFVEEFDWFKKFKEKYPSFTLVNGFYGEKDSYDTLTAQGVIDGKFYDSSGTHEETVEYYKKDPETKKPIKDKKIVIKKHRAGDWIKDTGYVIDFFVRLQPNLEQHENYFKLWKEIMIAKLKMGRDKDFSDWKAFVPYVKSQNSFNFNYEGFRHINYESSQNDAFEDVSDSDQKVLVKPGVPELFDSNPELANAVYQALGFETTSIDLTPSGLTSKPIGSSLDQSEGTGICDGTCGLMANRLQQAGMPYGHTQIEDKVANYHAVALTEIDGKRYILNQPQHEFLSIEYQKAPLWERAMFWRGMSQRFNRHLPRVLNDLYFSEGINPYPSLFGTIESEYFGEIGPIFKDKKIIKREGYSVVTGTLIENPSVRIAIKLEEGETLENINPEEADVQTTKDGEKVPVWTKTEFTPRFIEVTKENLIKEYQLTNEQADASIKAINKAIINPGTKTQITSQQKQQAQQLYSQYLDTIFPNSKVKDIVYHGSIRNFDKFKKLSDYYFSGTNKDISLDIAINFKFNDLFEETGKGINVRIKPSLVKEFQLNKQQEKKLIDLYWEKDSNGGEYSLFTLSQFKEAYNKIVGEELEIFNPQIKSVLLNITNLKKEKDLPIEYDNVLKIKQANPNIDGIVGKESLFRQKSDIDTYVVFESEQIHILGSKQDIEGFKEFVSVRPKISSQQIQSPLPNVKRVYRGKNSSEPERIGYFTVDKNEAKEYGPVSAYDVNTDGFLNVFENKELYMRLVLDFNQENKLSYDLLDNSPKGIETQAKFFDFVKNKGYKGLDFTDYSDSQYLISFDNNTFKEASDGPVAYNRYNSLHRFATDRLKLKLQDGGYEISDKGYMNYELTDEDINVIEGYIRQVSAPDNWRLKETKTGSWYIAGYKSGNVLDPNYYSPSTRNPGYYRYDNVSDVMGEDLAKNNPVEYNEEEKSNIKSINQLTAVVERLSEQFGVAYQIITSEEAKEITSDQINPWTDEKAFYHNKTVYFVGNIIDQNMAMHEFAHPFIRAISVANPALFNNLYDRLSETQEGRAIIEEVELLYEDIKEDIPFFKEEVIVRALELKAANDNTEKGNTSGFLEWIKNILIEIKQFLRGVSKKLGSDARLNVSALNEKTTLKELVDMIKAGEKFNLTEVTDNQLTKVAYSKYLRDQAEEILDLARVAHPDLIALATQGIKASIKSLRKIQNDNNHEEMLELFKDEFGKNDFEEIKGNLRPYQDYLEKRLKDVIDEVQYNQNHVESLVNTYYRLSRSMKKITAHLKLIAADPDNPNNIAKAIGYRRVINYWDSFIAFSLQTFAENKLGTNTPIGNLVSSINEEIRQAQDVMSTINSKGIRESLYSTLTPINIAGKQRFDEMLATYRKYNFKQYAIDRLFIEWYGLTEAEHIKLKNMENTASVNSKEYEILKNKSLTGAEITKEKIEALLKGELNDVNWMNSYFEGYLYNDDPVVGGFSLFVKQALDKTMVRSQMLYNDFSTELGALLKDSDYNPANPGKLGRDVGFIDSFGYTDKDGKFEKKTVWSLLNKWKDYRYVTDEMNNKIYEARLNWYRTNSESDRNKLIELNYKKEEHDLKYMHQKYVPEYYLMRSNFTNNGTNKIALDALAKRDEKLNTIRALQEKMLVNDESAQIPEQVEQAWRDYNQLHSLYDLDGEMKKNDDLKIAQELQRFRNISREYYEYNPIPRAFDTALFAYEQKLINKGIRNEQFDADRRAWINRNTHVKVTQNFYEERRTLLEELKDLLTVKIKDPEVAAEQAEINKEISDAYDKVFSALSGFRDEDGQPDASAMSEGRIKSVKDNQQLINDLKDKVIGVSGLSKEEQRELRSLEEKENPTKKEEQRMFYLTEMKNSLLTKEQRKRLRKIFDELNGLSYSEPTDYYLDAFDGVIETLEKDPKNKKVLDTIKGHYGSTLLSKDHLNDLLQPRKSNKFILKELLNIKVFKEWFEKNHVTQKTYDTDLEGYVTKYTRLLAWSVTKPIDKKYYEKHEIRDENNKLLETLDRIPNRKYWKREVKQKYETGYTEKVVNGEIVGDVNLIVGTHIDNKGRWLPRENVLNNPYKNEGYYKLKAEDPKKFKILEALTKWHLKIQDKLENSARLYMDFPRFEQDSLEIGTMPKKDKEGEKKISKFKLVIRNIKQFFTGNREMPESGFGMSDDFKVAELDIYDDNDEYKAPIRGLYDIPADETSTNITRSMLRYMISAEENKTLTEIYPYAEALQDALEGKGLDKIKRISKSKLANAGEFTSRNKDQNKTRRDVVSNFIDREFKGQTIAGPGANNKSLHSITNGIFQTASFGFFALNITSAVKNAAGQKIQGFIESIAGRYYNPKDYIKAEGWSFKTMGELSFQIYKDTPKSKDVQLWEIFDPLLDFQNKPSKEGMSRTVFEDATNPVGIAMNFRKWTELQSMMQIWAAMMYNIKVDQNGKTISLIDAWEVIDGRIQLKKGVDPEWGITYNAKGEQIIGTKFLAKRQEMQAVTAKLQGAYDKFNQPEAQRFIVFKFISFLRRYFTPMLMDRFGFKWKNGQIQPRLQPGLGTVAEGWYWSLLRHLYDSLRMGPKRLIYATPDERRAWLKTTGDVSILILLYIMQELVFGWDDDDEERYAKLREKSGPMRAPFVAEDEYEFKLKGWLANHGLNMLMQVKAEQQQFIPLPAVGAQTYADGLSNLGGSAALGPTLSTAFNLMQDIYNYGTGSEKAYYQKEVGPYEWQQQEGSKFVAHLAKSAGLTGTFWQPELGIRKLQSVQEGFAGGR